MEKLANAALAQLFTQARTHTVWSDKDISPEILRDIFNLMRMGPTSANMQPARIVFVRTPEAKQRLKPWLVPGNVKKTMAAPVCAIIGYDSRFYEFMPKIFPHEPAARSWFDSDPKQAEIHALRNSSLQGAYLILAARALGLDCGPMSGFDAEGVAKAFFPGGRIRPNFLCNLGYGVGESLHPRSPRFEFDEVCEIV